MKSGPVITGWSPDEFVSIRCLYVVTVTSNPPRLKVGSTDKMAWLSLVQNLSRSFKVQSNVSKVIGSGAPVTIWTNDLEYCGLHSLYTCSSLQIVDLFSFQLMAHESLQCVANTCCLFCGSDPTLVAEARPPEEEDTSQMANFGVRSWATFFSFWRVLGMVQRKLFVCLEFPCGRSSTGCSSSLKVYCTKEWVSASPSTSVQINRTVIKHKCGLIFGGWKWGHHSHVYSVYVHIQ